MCTKTTAVYYFPVKQLRVQLCPLTNLGLFPLLPLFGQVIWEKCFSVCEATFSTCFRAFIVEMEMRNITQLAKALAHSMGSVTIT